MIKELNHLQVIDDQRGVPTTTDFLAKMTLSLIKRYQKTDGNLPRLIHAVPDGATSWFGFASHIRDILMQYVLSNELAEIEPVSSSKYPQAATRPANSVMSNDLLQSSLGKSLGRWEDWHNSLHIR